MKGIRKKPKLKEPDRLVRGKKFEKKLINQKWFLDNEAKYQEPVIKSSGRKGRIDGFMLSSKKKDKDLVVVLEFKASDWDSMTLPAVRRNVRRQANQIWDYIDSQIEKGKQVSPGIMFEKKPEDPERLRLIERMFDEQCIPVSWEDEGIENRNARS